MRYFYLTCLFMLCSVQLFSDRTYYPDFDYTPFTHEYVGHYTYEGDADGDFKGDLVVMLEDGSKWKIHPSHREQLADWAVGDKVHIDIRTSYYLLKREHKFLLFNHRKNSGLFVMLVETPYTISEAHKCVPTKRTENGIFPYVYSNYKQNLIFNDSSKWQINCKNSTPFTKDTPVYIGYNESPEVALDPKKKWGSFFIITGVGKGAKWAWAVRGNYFYYDIWI